MQEVSIEPREGAAFLAKVPLFRHLRGEEQLLLAQETKLLTYQKDESIYGQGQMSDALYVIRTGAVGMFVNDPVSGLHLEVERLDTGSVFGELTLLTGEKRDATTKAMDRTACFRVSSSALEQVSTHAPAIATALARAMAERVRVLGLDRSSTISDLIRSFDPELYLQLPPRVLEQHRLLPIDRVDGRLRVATSDAQNLAGLDEARRMLKASEVKSVPVSEGELNALLAKFRPLISGREASMQKQRRPSAQTIHWHTKVEEDEARRGPPVDARGDDVKLLYDRLVAEAIGKAASDIHIEPGADQTHVRYRIAGRLVPRGGEPIPPHWHPPLVSRIKVLAELDISERRRPQDGRMTCDTGDRTYDLRVSTMPTHGGEKVVLRLLDSAQALQPIEQLILADKVCRVVQKMLARPHGVIYVCGPTGSGKTTTLYSALGLVKGDHINITTVEDPIEYNINGIVQVNVKPEIDLTFAKMLRSILRQDPNIILVGETRDRETGQLVLEAGLTGHLVLTSLHTNDAIGSIQRLREMKLENFAIASSLIGIISQRLVRRLCPACSEEGPLAEPVLQQLVHADVLPSGFNRPLRMAKGCNSCEGTGYIGRVGVYEILLADDALRQQIMLNATQYDIREAALKGAFVPIAKYANYLLANGITTGEELLAVIAS